MPNCVDTANIRAVPRSARPPAVTPAHTSPRLDYWQNEKSDSFKGMDTVTRNASSSPIKVALVLCGLIAVLGFAGVNVYRNAIAHSIVNAIDAGAFERAFTLTTENDLPSGRFRIAVLRAAYGSPAYHRFVLDRWHKDNGDAFPTWAHLVLYNAVVSETLDAEDVLAKARDKRRQLQSNRVDASQLEELKFVDTIERKALEALSKKQE